ncbi:MAG: hypothetical protein R3321_08655, partial [Nitrososphaeraceae archaeon]|nr:hypothetical protein [Nitrososphaeraceae archaeon]
DEYKRIMKEKIEAIYKAESLESHQQLANDFERISQKEPQEWLPLYYAAYSYINMGFMNSLTLSQKDIYFHKANELLKKASTLSENNSEITALKGYSKMGELSADAANRGQTLSPVVMQLFGMAIQQDPKNPRALYLMAQMEYGMAQFFGSSTDKACSYVAKSIPLFNEQDQNVLSPSWGANAAEAMANRCQ